MGVKGCGSRVLPPPVKDDSRPTADGISTAGRFAGTPLAMKVMINYQGGMQTVDIARAFGEEHRVLSDTARLPRHENVMTVVHSFVDSATSAALPGWEFDEDIVAARTQFVLMPLLGCDAKQLARRGALHPDTVATLMRDTLSAVQHLSEHRLIHRDIKADNLMVVGDHRGDQALLRFVLTDMGECLDCEYYRLDRARLPLPVEGGRGGAPAFLAPEVLRPWEPGLVLDFAKADEWACGFLFHGLLSEIGPPLPSFV